MFVYLQGKSVEKAKPFIKDQLVKAKEAVLYMEPENKIVSRFEFRVNEFFY